MHFQQRYLEDTKAFASTSGLDTIDLPNKGYLSGIEMRVWGTCGVGADKPDVWLHDRMTKLELVVNGSKVVKSLSGDQLLADMLYKKTPLFSHDMKNMVNASAEEFFYINLGRFYHDPDYMLDLSRVNDPELRIDYDFGMTSHDGWTNGIAMAAAPSYSLIPHILREPEVLPKGYLKTSEVYRFTGGVSKVENMKLPIGPVYASLYLQSYYASQGLGYLLDKVELNINSDDIIPVRVGATELAAEIVRQYGLFHIMQQTGIKGGQAYPWPIEQGVFQPAPLGLVAQEFQYMDLWGNAGAPGLKDTATGLTPSTASINVAFLCLGVWPFSVSAIPIFDLMDERTWIDSSKLGDLWLRVEGNASMGTSVVVKLLADEVVTSY